MSFEERVYIWLNYKLAIMSSKIVKMYLKDFFCL